LGRAGYSDIKKIKYVSLDGGGDAITQTIGGFTQAMTGDISEAVGFLKSGDVRVLAVLTDERIPGDLFADIPTAKEQGIDVVAVNWRGLYVPKDISDDDYGKWSDALAKVAESDEWATAMEANGLAPFTKVGDDFQGYLDGVIKEVGDLSLLKPPGKFVPGGCLPNFATNCSLLLLFFAVAIPAFLIQAFSYYERPNIRCTGQSCCAWFHRQCDSGADELSF